MKNTFPLVSVIVPTYNQRLDFMRDTIDSILVQDYPNLEIVISDNHTNNGTELYIQSLTDRRVRIVAPPRFLNLVENFGFGADNAKGDFISFLPSDDLIEPGWVSKAVIALLENEHANLVYGECACVEAEDSSKQLYTCRDYTLASGYYDSHQMLKMHVPYTRYIGWMVGGLVRRKSYLQVGGIVVPGINYMADHALSALLATQGGAVYINELAGKHRVWGAEEGKTEGERSIKNTLDLIRLYELFDEPQFVPFIPAFAEKLNDAKKSQGWLLLYSLLLISTKENLDIKTAQIFKTTAKAFDPSLKMQIASKIADLPYLRAILVKLLPLIRMSFRGSALRRMRNHASISR
jgi:glycosyltransferase involved in cell wall biosynthesis